VKGARSLRLGREGPVLVVLLVVSTGLVLVAMEHWRRGLYLVAGGCLLGAVFRLGLPARRAGLLAVRSRTVDVATLTAFGLAGIVLARLIPTGG
jgi:hypothetical protein